LAWAAEIKLTRYRLALEETDDVALCMAEDAESNLWVGTDGGVAGFAPSLIQTLTAADGLSSGQVRALAEDQEGRLWIGTGSGLSIWDENTLRAVEYDGEPYRHKIRALHVGRDGAVWVGAAQGLYRFLEGHWTAWSVRDGLLHENVCVMVDDREGGL